jgi:cell division protein FtsW
MIKQTIDLKLFFAILILLIFWMIMISSVSIYPSFKLTSFLTAKWIIDEPYNYFYVIRNIIHVLISLLILWIIVKIPYKFFEKNVKIIAWIVGFMLIFVLINWLAFKWARWWINIPWVPFTIQPTEFLKFSLIIFLAHFFKVNKDYLWSLQTWFFPFLWIIWSVVLLVWLQPDFWTLMVILPVSVIMYFITWAKIKNLAIMWLLWVFLILWVYFAWDYDKKTWKNLNKLWYITKRIDNFLAPNEEAIRNKTINYQTKQGLIAIWSWGFSGLWFWNSIQKFGYLPEVQW